MLVKIFLLSLTVLEATTLFFKVISYKMIFKCIIGLNQSRKQPSAVMTMVDAVLEAAKSHIKKWIVFQFIDDCKFSFGNILNQDTCELFCINLVHNVVNKINTKQFTTILWLYFHISLWLSDVVTSKAASTTADTCFHDCLCKINYIFENPLCEITAKKLLLLLAL